MANTFNLGNGNWATKKEAVLAYNSENNNFKPLPFSFDRASTATVVNKDGLIETVGVDEPRIDFLNNTKGHLLLEPQRTNSFLQSNNFNTSWSVSNATLTGGQSGVGGSNDAWLFTASSGTNEKKIFQSSPLSGNVAVSVYAKKGTNDYLWLRGVTSGFAIRTWFNLSTGQVATDNAVSSEMVDMGNGWYRCIAIFNQDAGWDFHIGNSNQDNQVSVNTTGTIYIQYAQSEAGSYATSYIPTSGSAVTRVADACNNGANEQVINSTEGVLYYEASYIDGSDYNSISISNLSGSEKSRTWYDDTNLIFASYVNNVNQTFISYPIFKNINYKIAIRYKLNDFALYVNGNKATNIVVNLGGVSPQNSYNKLNFNSGDIYNKFYGNIKDLRVYNTALSDSELQALTSN